MVSDYTPTALDGFYVIRTSVDEQRLSTEQVLDSYKRLSKVEHAFRSMKTVDLKVRPIYHRMERRVRAHLFLFMLAYYVEFEMRKRLTPLLFDDGHEQRLVVKAAKKSPSAYHKSKTKLTVDGERVVSFQGLMKVMATVARNVVEPLKMKKARYWMVTKPSAYQQKVLDLLDVNLNIF